MKADSEKTPADRLTDSETLLAAIQAPYFRAVGLARLRLLVPVSSPLWLRLAGLRLPGWLAWLLVLGSGYLLSEAVAWGLLERASARRAGPRSSPQAAAARWDSIRFALLWSLAALTTWPLACAAWSAPATGALSRAGVRLWLALLVVTAGVESLPPVGRALLSPSTRRAAGWGRAVR